MIQYKIPSMRFIFFIYSLKQTSLIQYSEDKTIAYIMKNLFFVFLVVGIALTGCQSVNDAESIADQFHEKFDAHDHEFIIKNMIDPVEIEAEGEDAWFGLLEGVASWGVIKNREKSSGFNYKSNNGISTVKLKYSFENDMGKMYEAIVLCDRGEGYKILVLSFNTDEAAVDEYTKDFQ